MIDRTPSLIALDWGTTSLRAWLLDASGEILASEASTDGILQLEGHEFAAAYRRMVGAWHDVYPDLPAIACGMIGSRNGWTEVDYLDCPVQLTDLSLGLTPVRDTVPRLVLVPGLLFAGDADNGSGPDIMRGEETQVLGALSRESELSAGALFALPGTHCKWVDVTQARLVRFNTYMTGELFSVLGDHSILGALAGRQSPEPAAACDAFEQGLETARRAGGYGLGHVLFSARTRVIAGDLAADQSLDYLSGLIIGDELLSVIRARGGDLPPVRLIGESALCERYRSALTFFGMTDVAIVRDAAIAGLWRLAEAAGLLLSDVSPGGRPCSTTI